MSGFFELIRKAEEGGPNADAYYRAAMTVLVGVYDRQTVAGPAAPEQLKRFREDSGEVLVNLGDQITAYVHRAITYAEGADDSQLYELYVRRSVIQSLLDDYQGTTVPDRIDPTDLADLDAEIRRAGLRNGPLPEDWIPKGLPTSHWWWTHPADDQA